MSDIALGSRTGRFVIAAAVLGSGMALLDGTVVNVALVRIGKELGASLADLQWITNGYLLALASLILLGGSLGDRFGRRRVFVIGVGLVHRSRPPRAGSPSRPSSSSSRACSKASAEPCSPPAACR